MPNIAPGEFFSCVWGGGSGLHGNPRTPMGGGWVEFDPPTPTPSRISGGADFFAQSYPSAPTRPSPTVLVSPPPPPARPSNPVCAPPQRCMSVVVGWPVPNCNWAPVGIGWAERCLATCRRVHADPLLDTPLRTSTLGFRIFETFFFLQLCRISSV